MCDRHARKVRPPIQSSKPDHLEMEEITTCLVDGHFYVPLATALFFSHSHLLIVTLK